MEISRSPIAYPCVLLFAAMLVALVAPPSDAIEVRHTEGARYAADLTRAYAECVAPNTTTSTGVPACTPAVTSACGFTTGGLDMRKREDTNEIDLDAFVNNVSGPGSCSTGPYTLQLNLRMSFDDASCASGSCTLVDAPISIPLLLNGNDFRRRDFTLESAFPGPVPPISNYEILHAVVIAPDGLPIAAAGAGELGTEVFSDLSVAYPPCTVPDTANTWGVPACSAPVWESPCDFSLTDSEIERASVGPRLRPRGFGLIGAPSFCADGVYTLGTLLRITTDACGSLCTVVDFPASVPVEVVDGEVDSSSILLSTALGLEFLEDDDTTELLSLILFDPMGNLLAGLAVTPTLRIDTTRVTAFFKDAGNLNDDVLTIKGKFPHPPLDPTVGGTTFTVRDKDGVVYTATIPAGSWVEKIPGRKWLYKDDLGTINDVRRAEISEFRVGGSPTGYRLRLIARDTDLSAADLPALDVVVAASNTGAGTEVATRGTVCKRSPTRLSCK